MTRAGKRKSASLDMPDTEKHQPLKTEPNGKVRTLVCDPNDPHKDFGGTDSPAFNLVVVNQAGNALWIPAATDERTKETLIAGAAGALISIAPKDAIEGMLATQMVATHTAAMECYRRAMMPSQTFEGRQAALGQANKLTRSYAALVQALDKHRGRGQQTVRVEHVHIHEGSQAVIGNVHAPAGGRGTPENPETTP